jgi:hypothetical protein
MAYRLTDTGKWDDEWFVDLNPHQKLMFMYFCDNCDIAGFYELSLRKMSFDLNMSADDVKTAFKGLNKSYIISKDKKVLFLKNFIKHQKNTPLNTSNKSHVGIIARYKLYKDKFDFSLLSVFEHQTKKVAKKGLGSNTRSSTGKGIGNDIFKEDKFIEFEVFWNLYSYRVGDKKKSKAKWETLEYEIQEKIIVTLPEWNKQFDGIHFKPHPLTYLNQERWNDDIIKLKEEKSKTGVTAIINF